jgi:hypothetical protein
MIRAFNPEDMKDFKESENPDTKIFGFMGDLTQKYVDGGGVTMSWFNDKDELTGVGGVMPLWDGVGEVWLLLTEEGKKSSVSLLKDSKWFIEYLLEKEGYHRLQCSIVCEFVSAHRFISACGFVPEGIMADYGPNKEHFTRYVRFA